MKRTRVFLFVLFFMAIATAKAQLLMDGYVGYRIYGSRVRIDVEEINNFGTNKTDKIRFRLWASEHQWSPSQPGYLLAVAQLPRIPAHQDLDRVHRYVTLHRPPRDWYHITLVLEERVVDETGARFEIRDVVEFDGERYFGRPLPFPF